MNTCVGCGTKCHPIGHNWELIETEESTHLCNRGVAVFEITEDGSVPWCAVCWLRKVDKQEKENIVAERRDAVANGRHWV